MKVAVGLSPRSGPSRGRVAERRLRTDPSDSLLHSRSATEPSRLSDPLTEVHGYLQCLAPRDQTTAPRHPPKTAKNLILRHRRLISRPGEFISLVERFISRVGGCVSHPGKFRSRVSDFIWPVGNLRSPPGVCGSRAGKLKRQSSDFQRRSSQFVSPSARDNPPISRDIPGVE